MYNSFDVLIGDKFATTKLLAIKAIEPTNFILFSIHIFSFKERSYIFYLKFFNLFIANITIVIKYLI